ncbi:hypothetical protein ACA910_018244 [Epithemia clementina (nom. ined.)]
MSDKSGNRAANNGHDSDSESSSLNRMRRLGVSPNHPAAIAYAYKSKTTSIALTHHTAQRPDGIGHFLDSFIMPTYDDDNEGYSSPTDTDIDAEVRHLVMFDS